MTPEEQRFNSWKYSRRISLVYLGDDLFGVAGPDLKLQGIGDLDSQMFREFVKQLARELEANPHCVQHKPVEELSLDYLTEIDL